MPQHSNCDGIWVNQEMAYTNLVGLANIARAIGHFEAAATLLGAEDTYRRFIGHSSEWSWAIPREQEQQALRAQLGDARFSELWEAGKALSIEQAIAMALDLADEWRVRPGAEPSTRESVSSWGLPAWGGVARRDLALNLLSDRSHRLAARATARPHPPP